MNDRSLGDVADYDLWYDATTVGSNLVVETWISHVHRTSDETFDPQPGDWVLVGDEDEPPISGRVTRRNGNKVWVQLNLVLDSPGAPSHHVGCG